MIPDRLEPNLAPGGVVAIAFDAAHNEVTRSIVTPDRSGAIEWLAADAALAVNGRGGGLLIAYDGDTGDKMMHGPEMFLDDEGNRLAVRHHIEELNDLVPIVTSQFNGHWPWQLIGVFAVEGDEMPAAWWHAFCYTSGLGDPELWVPCASIEDRYASPEVIGQMLNIISCGWSLGVVQCGDSVTIPLGVPNGDDIDTVWWIGGEFENADKRQVFQSRARTCVPILWSSGLGWHS